MTGRFSVLLVAAALAAAPAAALAGQADLLFVVDGARSMGKAGEASRARSFAATITSIHRNGIGRVGVVAFGGRMETTPEKAAVFALKPLPSDPADDAKFFADMEKELAARLSFDFTASDFNAPFSMQGGILDLLRARDEEKRGGRLVVLLVSDGDFQVVEMAPGADGMLESAVFEQYAVSAREKYGDLNRESVNRIAAETFASGVTEVLRGSKSFILAPAAFRQGQAVSAEWLALGFSGSLDFGPDGFLKSSLALAALLDPENEPERHEDMETLVLKPGEEVRRALLVNQGAESLLIASAFDRQGVTLEVTEPSGGGAPGAVLTGMSGFFPCVRIPYPAPGAYALVVRNNGTGDARGIALLYRKSGYGLVVETETGAGKFFSGDSLKLTFRMTFGPGASVVTDPEVLRESMLFLNLKKDGKPAVEETRIGFENLEEGVRSFAMQLGDGTLEGKYSLEVVLKAFRTQDAWKAATRPVEIPLLVERGIPVVEIEFDKSDSFIGERVKATGRLRAGRMPAAPIPVEFALAGADGRLTTTLYVAADGTMTGDVNFTRKGTWQIEPRKLPDGISLTPGPAGVISVRERNVRLFVMEGGSLKEVDGITSSADLGSETEGEGVKAILKADLKEDEKGSFSLAWKAPDLLSAWTSRFSVAGKETAGMELDGSLPSREFGMVLLPSGGYSVKEKSTVDGGTLIVTGKLGGVEVRREFPVKVEVTPGKPPWYTHPLIIAAAAIVLVGIVCIVLLLRMPRFASQNLVLEDQSPAGKPPFFFVDNSFGCGKRKAIGTEEVERAAKFFVKGRGKAAKCFIKPSPDAEVKVNGRKIAGTFMLGDGNLLEIGKPGTDPFVYRYYDHASAPVDLGDDEFVIMEYDDEEEFVVGDGEVLVELPEELARALEEAQAAEGAQEDQAAPAAPPASGKTDFGVDVSSSPTALPERLATGADMDEDATIMGPAPAKAGIPAPAFDEDATMLPDRDKAKKPASGKKEKAPDPKKAEKEEVPPVDASAFGDFFDDERTSHTFEAEEGEEEDLSARVDESKDKSKHADMFDDGITIMGFDGKSVTEMLNAEKKKQIDEAERKAKEEEEKKKKGKK